MNRCLRLGLAAGLGSLLGCSAIDPLTGPAKQSGSADFSVYVAMGTSLGAGYSNGGLVDRHQRHSYPYLFAQQAMAAAFTYPCISDSGIPALLVLRSYSPLVVTQAASQGGPGCIAQPTSYHNMSVPGALLVDVLDSTAVGYNRGLFPVIQRGRGLILDQALGLSPTFVSFEYGSNEVLSAAAQGSGTLLSPAFQPGPFAAMYTTAMNRLAAGAPNARLALFNVPDVTSIPFFTTFPPFTVNLSTGSPVPLVGASGDLGAGDLVLLTAGALIAQGNGIPVGGYNYVNPSVPGNGQGLPETVILRAQEVADLQTIIAAYNAIIDTVATGRDAALVDLNSLLRELATNGIRHGPAVYTEDFVTGGAFGLDGIHPTDLGYAIMANAMIDAVNAKFGATLPHVSLSAAASRGRYALRPADGELPSRPLVLGLDRVVRDLYGWRDAPVP